MASLTSHYSLQRLQQGDALSTNGYKFTDVDKQIMDTLLYIGAESHKHTGLSKSTVIPTQAPTLVLGTTSGSIPAGTIVYYKYTYVDNYGNESTPSPEATVTTPTVVTEPQAPILSTANSGGTLAPGNYYYVLSAYTTSTNQETRALNPSFLTVPIGSALNTVTVGFPSLPSGASGFNIYRRGPADSTYYFLTSVAVTGGGTPTPSSYTDAGSVAATATRTLPVANTTNSQNNVTITLPGATPTVPAGFTWKIYRTYVPGNYNSSLVHSVVEWTSDVSGIVTPTYQDMGLATLNGSPPITSTYVGNPSKVQLTNTPGVTVQEVQGQLPPFNVSAFPMTVSFAFPGTVLVQNAPMIWVCDFPNATIKSVRAVLGRGSVPLVQNVIVDVLKGLSSATPTFASIFGGLKPMVWKGQTVGSMQVPVTTKLNQGDALAVNITQAGGGGATPSDHDLLVNVYLYVWNMDTTTFVAPLT